MSVGTVANDLGKARNEVNAYKDKSTKVIAQDLALSIQESRLIGALGAAMTAPGAPAAPVASLPVAPVVVGTEVIVTFSPPASDGGDEITEYVVVSTPGAFSKTVEASPAHVTGAFVTATGYTFTVQARNSVGNGAVSPASNSVTPNP